MQQSCAMERHSDREKDILLGQVREDSLHPGIKIRFSRIEARSFGERCHEQIVNKTISSVIQRGSKHDKHITYYYYPRNS